MPWTQFVFCFLFFFKCLVLSQLLHSTSFTLLKRLISSFVLSAIRDIIHISEVVVVLLPILILACNSSCPAFLMMCSAYRLNKQDDSREPCLTPYPILNQSFVPYRVLTVASWPPYSFLRRQVRCSDISNSLRAFHSLLWSAQSRALV